MAAFTGANVANAMGLAIGLLGAVVYMAEFYRAQTMRMLRETIEELKESNKKLRAEVDESRDEASKERARAYESELRLRQSGLLTAADMVERFREKPREPESPK